MHQSAFDSHSPAPGSHRRCPGTASSSAVLSSVPRTFLGTWGTLGALGTLALALLLNLAAIRPAQAQTAEPQEARLSHIEFAVLGSADEITNPFLFRFDNNNEPDTGERAHFTVVLTPRFTEGTVPASVSATVNLTEVTCIPLVPRADTASLVSATCPIVPSETPFMPTNLATLPFEDVQVLFLQASQMASMSADRRSGEVVFENGAARTLSIRLRLGNYYALRRIEATLGVDPADIADTTSQRSQRLSLQSPTRAQLGQIFAETGRLNVFASEGDTLGSSRLDIEVPAGGTAPLRFNFRYSGHFGTPWGGDGGAEFNLNYNVRSSSRYSGRKASGAFISLVQFGSLFNVFDNVEGAGQVSVQGALLFAVFRDSAGQVLHVAVQCSATSRNMCTARGSGSNYRRLPWRDPDASPEPSIFWRDTNALSDYFASPALLTLSHDFSNDENNAARARSGRSFDPPRFVPPYDAEFSLAVIPAEAASMELLAAADNVTLTTTVGEMTGQAIAEGSVDIIMVGDFGSSNAYLWPGHTRAELGDPGDPLNPDAITNPGSVVIDYLSPHGAVAYDFEIRSVVVNFVRRRALTALTLSSETPAQSLPEAVGTPVDYPLQLVPQISSGQLPLLSTTLRLSFSDAAAVPGELRFLAAAGIVPAADGRSAVVTIADASTLNLTVRLLPSRLDSGAVSITVAVDPLSAPPGFDPAGAQLTLVAEPARLSGVRWELAGSDFLDYRLLDIAADGEPDAGRRATVPLRLYPEFSSAAVPLSSTAQLEVLALLPTAASADPAATATVPLPAGLSAAFLASDGVELLDAAGSSATVSFSGSAPTTVYLQFDLVNIFALSELGAKLLATPLEGSVEALATTFTATARVPGCDDIAATIWQRGVFLVASPAGDAFVSSAVYSLLPAADQALALGFRLEHYGALDPEGSPVLNYLPRTPLILNFDGSSADRAEHIRITEPDLAALSAPLRLVVRVTDNAGTLLGLYAQCDDDRLSLCEFNFNVGQNAFVLSSQRSPYFAEPAIGNFSYPDSARMLTPGAFILGVRTDFSLNLLAGSRLRLQLSLWSSRRDNGMTLLTPAAETNLDIPLQLETESAANLLLRYPGYLGSSSDFRVSVDTAPTGADPTHRYHCSVPSALQLAAEPVRIESRRYLRALRFESTGLPLMQQRPPGTAVDFEVTVTPRIGGGVLPFEPVSVELGLSLLSPGVTSTSIIADGSALVTATTLVLTFSDSNSQRLTVRLAPFELTRADIGVTLGVISAPYPLQDSGGENSIRLRATALDLPTELTLNPVADANGDLLTPAAEPGRYRLLLRPLISDNEGRRYNLPAGGRLELRVGGVAVSPRLVALGIDDIYGSAEALDAVPVDTQIPLELRFNGNLLPVELRFSVAGFSASLVLDPALSPRRVPPAGRLLLDPLFACVLSDSGTVSCWGGGSGAAALRHGNSDGNNGRSLSGGTYRTFAIAQLNNALRLGNSRLASTVGQSCAHTTDGGLSCWGLAEGAMRHLSGISADSAAARPASALVGRRVYELGYGDDYACALLRSATPELSPTATSIECQENNGLPLGLSRNNLPTAVEPAAFVALATGSELVCALSASGRLVCWDTALGNVVALGGAEPRGLFALAAGDFVCAAGRGTERDNAWCWGGAYGTTPVAIAGLPSDVRIAQLTVGSATACALTAAGNVYCWRGSAGAAVDLLGIGGATLPNQDANEAIATAWPVVTAPRSGADPAAATARQLLSDIGEVRLSAAYACALRLSGGFFCWGDLVALDSDWDVSSYAQAWQRPEVNFAQSSWYSLSLAPLITPPLQFPGGGVPGFMPVRLSLLDQSGREISVIGNQVMITAELSDGLGEVIVPQSELSISGGGLSFSLMVIRPELAAAAMLTVSASARRAGIMPAMLTVPLAAPPVLDSLQLELAANLRQQSASSATTVNVTVRARTADAAVVSPGGLQLRVSGSNIVDTNWPLTFTDGEGEATVLVSIELLAPGNDALVEFSVVGQRSEVSLSPVMRTLQAYPVLSTVTIRAADTTLYTPSGEQSLTTALTVSLLYTGSNRFESLQLNLNISASGTARAEFADNGELSFDAASSPAQVSFSAQLLEDTTARVSFGISGSVPAIDLTALALVADTVELVLRPELSTATIAVEVPRQTASGAMLSAAVTVSLLGTDGRAFAAEGYTLALEPVANVAGLRRVQTLDLSTGMAQHSFDFALLSQGLDGTVNLLLLDADGMEQQRFVLTLRAAAILQSIAIRARSNPVQARSGDRHTSIPLTLELQYATALRDMRTLTVFSVPGSEDIDSTEIVLNVPEAAEGQPATVDFELTLMLGALSTTTVSFAVRSLADGVTVQSETVDVELNPVLGRVVFISTLTAIQTAAREAFEVTVQLRAFDTIEQPRNPTGLRLRPSAPFNIASIDGQLADESGQFAERALEFNEQGLAELVLNIVLAEQGSDGRLFLDLLGSLMLIDQPLSGSTLTLVAEVAPLALSLSTAETDLGVLNENAPLVVPLTVELSYSGDKRFEAAEVQLTALSDNSATVIEPLRSNLSLTIGEDGVVGAELNLSLTLNSTQSAVISLSVTGIGELAAFSDSETLQLSLRPALQSLSFADPSAEQQQTGDAVPVAVTVTALGTDERPFDPEGLSLRLRPGTNIAGAARSTELVFVGGSARLLLPVELLQQGLDGAVFVALTGTLTDSVTRPDELSIDVIAVELPVAVAVSLAAGLPSRTVLNPAVAERFELRVAVTGSKGGGVAGLGFELVAAVISGTAEMLSPERQQLTSGAGGEVSAQVDITLGRVNENAKVELYIEGLAATVAVTTLTLLVDQEIRLAQFRFEVLSGEVQQRVAATAVTATLSITPIDTRGLPTVLMAGSYGQLQASVLDGLPAAAVSFEPADIVFTAPAGSIEVLLTITPPRGLDTTLTLTASALPAGVVVPALLLPVQAVEVLGSLSIEAPVELMQGTAGEAETLMLQVLARGTKGSALMPEGLSLGLGNGIDSAVLTFSAEGIAAAVFELLPTAGVDTSFILSISGHSPAVTAPSHTLLLRASPYIERIELSVPAELAVLSGTQSAQLQLQAELFFSGVNRPETTATFTVAVAANPPIAMLDSPLELEFVVAADGSYRSTATVNVMLGAGLMTSQLSFSITDAPATAAVEAAMSELVLRPQLAQLFWQLPPLPYRQQRGGTEVILEFDIRAVDTDGTAFDPQGLELQLNPGANVEPLTAQAQAQLQLSFTGGMAALSIPLQLSTAGIDGSFSLTLDPGERMPPVTVSPAVTVELMIAAVEVLASLALSATAAPQQRPGEPLMVTVETTATGNRGGLLNPEGLYLELVGGDNIVADNSTYALSFSAGTANLSLTVALQRPGVDGEANFAVLSPDGQRFTVSVPLQSLPAPGTLVLTATPTAVVVSSGSEAAVFNLSAKLRSVDGRPLETAVLLQLDVDSSAAEVVATQLGNSGGVLVFDPTSADAEGALILELPLTVQLGQARVTTLSFSIVNAPAGLSLEAPLLPVRAQPSALQSLNYDLPSRLEALPGDSGQILLVTPIEAFGSDGMPFDAEGLSIVVSGLSNARLLGASIPAFSNGRSELRVRVELRNSTQDGSMQIVLAGVDPALLSAPARVELIGYGPLAELEVDLIAGSAIQQVENSESPVSFRLRFRARGADGNLLSGLPFNAYVEGTAETDRFAALAPGIRQPASLRTDAGGEAFVTVAVTWGSANTLLGSAQLELRVTGIDSTVDTASIDDLRLRLTLANELARIELALADSSLQQRAVGEAVATMLTLRALGADGLPFMLESTLTLTLGQQHAAGARLPDGAVIFEPAVVTLSGLDSAAVRITVQPVSGLDSSIDFSALGAPAGISVDQPRLAIIPVEIFGSLSISAPAAVAQMALNRAVNFELTVTASGSKGNPFVPQVPVLLTAAHDAAIGFALGGMVGSSDNRLQFDAQGLARVAVSVTPLPGSDSRIDFGIQVDDAAVSTDTHSILIEALPVLEGIAVLSGSGLSASVLSGGEPARFELRVQLNYRGTERIDPLKLTLLVASSAEDANFVDSIGLTFTAASDSADFVLLGTLGLADSTTLSFSLERDPSGQSPLLTAPQLRVFTRLEELFVTLENPPSVAQRLVDEPLAVPVTIRARNAAGEAVDPAGLSLVLGGENIDLSAGNILTLSFSDGVAEQTLSVPLLIPQRDAELSLRIDGLPFSAAAVETTVTLVALTLPLAVTVEVSNTAQQLVARDPDDAIELAIRISLDYGTAKVPSVPRRLVLTVNAGSAAVPPESVLNLTIPGGATEVTAMLSQRLGSAGGDYPLSFMLEHDFGSEVMVSLPAVVLGYAVRSLTLEAPATVHQRFHDQDFSIDVRARATDHAGRPVNPAFTLRLGYEDLLSLGTPIIQAGVQDIRVLRFSNGLASARFNFDGNTIYFNNRPDGAAFLNINYLAFVLFSGESFHHDVHYTRVIGAPRPNTVGISSSGSVTVDLAYSSRFARLSLPLELELGFHSDNSVLPTHSEVTVVAVPTTTAISIAGLPEPLTVDRSQRNESQLELVLDGVESGSVRFTVTAAVRMYDGSFAYSPRTVPVTELTVNLQFQPQLSTVSFVALGTEGRVVQAVSGEAIAAMLVIEALDIDGVGLAPDVPVRLLSLGTDNIAALAPTTLSFNAAGRAELELQLQLLRQGYDGSLVLGLEGLPEGVASTTTVLVVEAREILQQLAITVQGNQVRTPDDTGVAERFDIEVRALGTRGNAFQPQSLQLVTSLQGGAADSIVPPVGTMTDLTFDAGGLATAVLMITLGGGRTVQVGLDIAAIPAEVSISTISLTVSSSAELASLQLSLADAELVQTAAGEQLMTMLTVAAIGSDGNPFRPAADTAFALMVSDDTPLPQGASLTFMPDRAVFDGSADSVQIALTLLPAAGQDLEFAIAVGGLGTLSVNETTGRVVAYELLAQLLLETESTDLLQSTPGTTVEFSVSISAIGSKGNLLVPEDTLTLIFEPADADLSISGNPLAFDSDSMSGVANAVITAEPSPGEDLALTLRVDGAAAEVRIEPLAVSIEAAPVLSTVTLSVAESGIFLNSATAMVEVEIGIELLYLGSNRPADGETLQFAIVASDPAITVTGGDGQQMVSTERSTLTLTVSLGNLDSGTVSISLTAPAAVASTELELQLTLRPELDTLTITTPTAELQQAALGMSTAAEIQFSALGTDGNPFDLEDAQLEVSHNGELQSTQLLSFTAGDASATLELEPVEAGSDAQFELVVRASDGRELARSPLILRAAPLLERIEISVAQPEVTVSRRAQSADVAVTVELVYAGDARHQSLAMTLTVAASAAGVSGTDDIAVSFDADNDRRELVVPVMLNDELMVNLDFDIANLTLQDIDVVTASARVVLEPVLASFAILSDATVFQTTLNTPHRFEVRVVAMGSDERPFDAFSPDSPLALLVSPEENIATGGGGRLPLTFSGATAMVNVTAALDVQGLPGRLRLSIAGLVGINSPNRDVMLVGPAVLGAVVLTVSGEATRLAADPEQPLEFTIDVRTTDRNGNFIPATGIAVSAMVINGTVQAISADSANPVSVDTDNQGNGSATIAVTIGRDSSSATLTVSAAVTDEMVTVTPVNISITREITAASLIVSFDAVSYTQASADEALEIPVTVRARNADSIGGVPLNVGDFGLEVRLVQPSLPAADISFVPPTLNFNGADTVQTTLSISALGGIDRRLTVAAVSAAVTSLISAQVDVVAAEVLTSLELDGPAQVTQQTAGAAQSFELVLTARGNRNNLLDPGSGLTLSDNSPAEVEVSYSALNFVGGIATVTVTVTPQPGTNLNLQFEIGGAADGVRTGGHSVQFIAVPILSGVVLSLQTDQYFVNAAATPVTISPQANLQFTGNSRPDALELMVTATAGAGASLVQSSVPLRFAGVEQLSADFSVQLDAGIDMATVDFGVSGVAAEVVITEVQATVTLRPELASISVTANPAMQSESGSALMVAIELQALGTDGTAFDPTGLEISFSGEVNSTHTSTAELTFVNGVATVNVPVELQQQGIDGVLGYRISAGLPAGFAAVAGQVALVAQEIPVRLQLELPGANIVTPADPTMPENIEVRLLATGSKGNPIAAGEVLLTLELLGGGITETTPPLNGSLAVTIDDSGIATTTISVTLGGGAEASADLRISATAASGITVVPTMLTVAAAARLAGVTISAPAASYTQLLASGVPAAVSIGLTVALQGSDNQPFTPDTALSWVPTLMRPDGSAAEFSFTPSPLVVDAAEEQLTLTVTPRDGISGNYLIGFQALPQGVDFTPLSVEIVAQEVLSEIQLQSATAVTQMAPGMPVQLSVTVRAIGNLGSSLEPPPLTLMVDATAGATLDFTPQLDFSGTGEANATVGITPTAGFDTRLTLSLGGVPQGVNANTLSVAVTAAAALSDIQFELLGSSDLIVNSDSDTATVNLRATLIYAGSNRLVDPDILVTAATVLAEVMIDPTTMSLSFTNEVAELSFAVQLPASADSAAIMFSLSGDTQGLTLNPLVATVVLEPELASIVIMPVGTVEQTGVGEDFAFDVILNALDTRGEPYTVTETDNLMLLMVILAVNNVSFTASGRIAINDFSGTMHTVRIDGAALGLELTDPTQNGSLSINVGGFDGVSPVEVVLMPLALPDTLTIAAPTPLVQSAAGQQLTLMATITAAIDGQPYLQSDRLNLEISGSAIMPVAPVSLDFDASGVATVSVPLTLAQAGIGGRVTLSVPGGSVVYPTVEVEIEVLRVLQSLMLASAANTVIQSSVGAELPLSVSITARDVADMPIAPDGLRLSGSSGNVASFERPLQFDAATGIATVDLSLRLIQPGVNSELALNIVGAAVEVTTLVITLRAVPVLGAVTFTALPDELQQSERGEVLSLPLQLVATDAEDRIFIPTGLDLVISGAVISATQRLPLTFDAVGRANLTVQLPLAQEGQGGDITLGIMRGPEQLFTETVTLISVAALARVVMELAGTIEPQAAANLPVAVMVRVSAEDADGNALAAGILELEASGSGDTRVQLPQLRIRAVDSGSREVAVLVNPQGGNDAEVTLNIAAASLGAAMQSPTAGLEFIVLAAPEPSEVQVYLNSAENTLRQPFPGAPVIFYLGLRTLDQRGDPIALGAVSLNLAASTDTVTVAMPQRQIVSSDTEIEVRVEVTIVDGMDTTVTATIAAGDLSAQLTLSLLADRRGALEAIDLDNRPGSTSLTDLLLAQRWLRLGLDMSDELPVENLPLTADAGNMEGLMSLIELQQEENEDRLDVNFDGRADQADIRLLIRYKAGFRGARLGRRVNLVKIRQLLGL